MRLERHEAEGEPEAARPRGPRGTRRRRGTPAPRRRRAARATGPAGRDEAKPQRQPPMKPRITAPKRSSTSTPPAGSEGEQPERRQRAGRGEASSPPRRRRGSARRGRAPRRANGVAGHAALLAQDARHLELDVLLRRLDQRLGDGEARAEGGDDLVDQRLRARWRRRSRRPRGRRRAPASRCRRRARSVGRRRSRRAWPTSTRRSEFDEFGAPITSSASICGAIALTAAWRLVVA